MVSINEELLAMTTNCDVWVWIEPIGFDNTLPDYGVNYYLQRAGFGIKGVSLLMTALDFILLHDGMEKEKELWPDACSRLAHERNQERDRQKWTTWQIRGLVQEFHKHGVQVYLSVFRYYLHDAWHREWISDHPEDIEWLTEYEDGTRFEDVFIPKLEQVVLDYGFDGWHAPDAQSPAGTVARALMTDNFLRAFFKECPQEGLDQEIIAPCNGNHEKELKRSEYMWRHCRFELSDFATRRWESFLGKAATMLHKHGLKLMVNSCCAKSVLESKFLFGLDTRHLPAIGVDIFVVEAVATSMHLVYGHEDTVYNIAAQLGELKAALPGVELILLTGVMDVVESFDAFQHCPARLLRDSYTIANQTFVENGKLSRIASGFMICLGDIADPHDWKMLDRMRKDNWQFDISTANGVTTVYDMASYDRLVKDYDRHGTIPPYLHASNLMRNGVELHKACAISELVGLNGSPVLIPEFDQLDDDAKAVVLARDGLTILTGNFHNGIPENAAAFVCRISDDYLFGCVILGIDSRTRLEVPKEKDVPEFDTFTQFSYVRDPIPMMHVPEALWKAASKEIETALHPDGKGLEFSEGDVYIIDQTSPDKRRHLAFCSNLTRYNNVLFRFASPLPQRIDNPHNFPCYPLKASDKDGLLGCIGHTDQEVFGRLVVPPKGLLIVESE